MATRRLNIYDLLSEANEIIKTDFGHYSPLSLLFMLPLSFSIVAYPTLQHTLATHQSKPRLPFPFNGYPIVFKPLSLFLLYLFTLLCLYLCNIGTITYSLYHRFSGQPVKTIPAIKSLSNSLLRLVATTFCAQLITFAGLVVIGLIVFGVTRGIKYFGLEIQYDSVNFQIICWMVFGLGFLCLNFSWVLAPMIVIVESSWGFEPLRRSAYLVKGYRGLGFRLLSSVYVMVWITLFGFGSCASYIPFGSSFYQTVLVLVTIACGAAILSRHLLHILVANTVFYMKCIALQSKEMGTQEEAAEDLNRDYVSLPLHEETVPHVV